MKVAKNGFALRTIFSAILWTVLLSSALGFSVKYGIELSEVVKASRDAPKHKGTVRIGVYNWPGYYPLITAQELGLFKKHGIDVELLTARNVGQLNDWIRTGHTQVSVGALADFVILKDLGTPIRMMMATDYSMADVLLADPKIRTAHDLIGKRIGISEINSFAEYFVIRSLELAGINPQSIFLFTVDMARVPDAIMKGEIDAGHTRDPALSSGIKRGLRPIISSSKNPELTIDGIAFRGEVALTNDVPLAIGRAFFEALALRKTDPIRFAAIPAKHFGSTHVETQGFLDEDIRFTDLDENIRLYRASGMLRSEASNVNRFFAERGMGNPVNDIKELIDDSVIRQLEDERAIGARDNAYHSHTLAPHAAEQIQ